MKNLYNIAIYLAHLRHGIVLNESVNRFNDLTIGGCQKWLLVKKVVSLEMRKKENEK